MICSFLTNGNRVWFYMSCVTLLFLVHTNKLLVFKLDIIFGVLFKFCVESKFCYMIHTWTHVPCKDRKSHEETWYSHFFNAYSDQLIHNMLYLTYPCQIAITFSIVFSCHMIHLLFYLHNSPLIKFVTFNYLHAARSTTDNDWLWA